MLKRKSCIILSTLISITTFAAPQAPKAGWEFTLSLNAGYSSSKSQFNTDSDNQITGNLNNSGQSTSSALVYPLGRIQYTLDSLKTQFFLGNSRDQVATAQFQYELGVTHQFNDDSKLTFAVFPKLALFSETWTDPFLVGNKRTKTDENIGGGRVAIDNILGSPLTLKYAIAVSSIDDEKSGQSQLTDIDEIASLKRDSLYQRVEVETLFPVAKGIILKPNLQYTQRDADGDANSYDQYMAKLTLLMMRDRHTLVTTFSAGIREYQDYNPIFDEKADSSELGVFSIYSYKKPFNWERWSWTLMAGYKQEDSKISFYDNKSFIISTGLVFKY